RDDFAACCCSAIALQLVGIVVGRCPVVRQFFARLDVPERNKHYLAGHTYCGLARMIAEDHAAFFLSLTVQPDVEIISDLYLGGPDRLLSLAQGAAIENVPPFDRHDLAFPNTTNGE